MLTKGSVLEDRYRILDRIGAGGTGRVYLALQIRTGRKLAVKEIEKKRCDGEGIREALKALKELRHPGLPIIIDIFEKEDCFYSVMEYMEGENLQELLNRKKAEGTLFTVAGILRIGIGLCGILDYLYSRPDAFLYLDLKPANILLRPDGSPALIDPESICVRDREEAMGTPGFAAPEQYSASEQAGPESVVYSLGATLYYMLTGDDPSQNPFAFPKLADKGRLEGRKKRERRSAMELEEILGICTRFRQEDRYRTLGELKAALEAVRDGTAGWKRGLGLALLTACLALMAACISFHAEQTGSELREQGAGYCLSKARRSTGEKSLEWLETALSLSPGDPECFAFQLEQMLGDQVFSAEEQDRMRALLDQTEEGEQWDNETLLKHAGREYLYFAFEMGTACCFLTGERVDYGEAGSWFGQVAADEACWRAETADEEAEKALLLEQAGIMEGVCRYRSQLRQEGDRDVLKGYWQELTALAESVGDTPELIRTGAALWKDILGLSFDWTMELAGEGITLEEQRQAAERIEKRIRYLDGAEDKPAWLKKLLPELAETTEIVKRKLSNMKDAEERIK